MRRRGYRKPAQSYAGVRTWVTRDSQRGIPADTTWPSDEDFLDPASSDVRERVLPMPESVPSQHIQDIPQPGFNAPIFEKGVGEGFEDVRIPPRTRSTPGEQYGTPSKNDYGYVTRRSMTGSVKRVARRYLATFFREERPPGDAPQNWLGDDQDRNTGVPRISPVGETSEGTSTWVIDQTPREKGVPAYELDVGQVVDNPGSAKVIPYNRDFVNNTDWRRYASIYLHDLDSNTSDVIKERALNYTPRKVYYNPKHQVWRYKVGNHTVTFKADFTEKAATFKRARFDVTCSCPFWRWGGPEHWAKKGDYLRGKPRGTASVPVIRDPEGVHGCCKHVYAVLDKIREQTVPRRRG